MEKDSPPRYGVNSRVFYLALFSVSAMTVLGSTAIAPSLPSLEKHFENIPHIDFLSRLALTLPAAFVVVFAPISGILFDRYARLKLLLPMVFLWALSGVAGFFLDNIYAILASRGVFGVATAFVMTGSNALIADYYHGSARERALSFQGLFNAFGGAVFLIFGGFLANINWRFPFLVYVLGFFIFALAFFVLFEPQKAAHKGTQARQDSRQDSRDSTQDSPRDLSRDSPQRFPFFRFFPIYCVGFFGMMIFYIIPTQIPYFIVRTLAKGGDLVGVSMALASIFAAISSFFYARLRRFLGLDSLYFLSFLCMGGGLVILALFHTYALLLVSLGVIGLGLGVFLVTNSSWLFSLTDDKNRAKAYGLLAGSIFNAQFLSPFVTQPFVKRFGLIEMFLIFGLLTVALGVGFLARALAKGRKK